VFATLTPHSPPTPKNGLRHFSALPTHHPTTSRKVCAIGQQTKNTKTNDSKKYFLDNHSVQNQKIILPLLSVNVENYESKIK